MLGKLCHSKIICLFTNVPWNYVAVLWPMGFGNPKVKYMTGPGKVFVVTKSCDSNFGQV